MRQNCLCVCQAGCVRSVALAYVLKYEFNFNAIATGVDFLTEKQTTQKLLEFADHILVVSDDVERSLAEIMRLFDLEHKSITNVNIGEDRWGLRLGPYNDRLLETAHNALTESGFVK